MLNNKAVTSAWVVLIHEGSRRNQPEDYHLATTDQNGRYTVTGVPPGEYRSYIFDQIEPGASMDSEFMKAWESKGTCALRSALRESK